MTTRDKPKDTRAAAQQSNTQDPKSIVGNTPAGTIASAQQVASGDTSPSIPSSAPAVPGTTGTETAEQQRIDDVVRMARDAGQASSLGASPSSVVAEQERRLRLDREQGAERGAAANVDVARQAEAEAAARAQLDELERAKAARSPVAMAADGILSRPAPEAAKVDPLTGPAGVQLVEFNRPTRLDLPGVLSLKPGINEVPVAVWEKTKEHPTILLYRREGHIREGARAENLGALDGVEAYRAVTGCYDLATLDRWGGQEQRPQIQAAIGEQRAKLRQAQDEARAAVARSQARMMGDEG